ncbi:Na+/H+ antiporter subunit A [Mycolicibacillus koreensis]|nr:Na+/H+ antiporter subunit A [Mycolicibacillus koreensis]
MLAILLAHAAAAASAPLLLRRWGRLMFYPLALVPAGSLVWVITHWPHPEQRVTVSWVPGLSMDIALRFDTLAAVMSVLVLGVGALVLCYCAEYFRPTPDHRPDPRKPGFAAKMVAFAGAMFGLMVADNMLVLYVFWELTTVLSFLLIGHYAERAVSRRAAIQALLVTTFGGLAMLGGIVMLGESTGSYLLSTLVAEPERVPPGTLTTVAVVLVLVGALSKSAILPLHFWLPGAMAAPAPVSAYLHAAAMVQAGVYLVARMAPGFADVPGWRPMVVGLGLATMLAGGWRAVREYDLKLLLAFSTVSQLGLMVALVGFGTADLMLAGLAVVVAHAGAKATLFMVVGIIDHATGTRDVRKLAGLGRRAPGLATIATAAAASMAAVPPFLGFAAKEAAFTALDEQPGFTGWLMLTAVAVGAVFTIIYSLRFLWGGFGAKGRTAPSRAVAEAHRPNRWFYPAPALLATLGLVLGLDVSRVDAVLRGYASTLGDGHYHLALWHGPSRALTLSALVLVAGAMVFATRGPLQLTRLRRLPLGNADRVYYGVLQGLDVLAVRVAGLIQRGSLPGNQAVILTTFVAVPLAALALGARPEPSLQWWDSPLQMTLAVLIIAAALGATVTRNRLAGVLMVGVTGYGCGTVFVFHGAPDLALTQFLVETITLVIFVLVLRALPASTERATMLHRRGPRAALAVAVGLAVAVLAAFAMAARDGIGVAALLAEAAYTRGHGSNTVNVLLVDIRAWDTLGEISVLLVAATGVASLVFRHRRFGVAPRVPTAAAQLAEPTVYSPAIGSTTWLRGSGYRDPRERSLVLEVTTRIIFPLIMVVSVYFFFGGHNTPGGGFAGGLTAGLALTLRYLAGGHYELGEALPLDPGKVLGVGLTLVGGTAVASLAFGAPALSSAVLSVTVPVLGEITLVTALFFDLGVYLVVVGLVLDVLRSLGARLDDEVPAGVAGPLVGTR